MQSTTLYKIMKIIKIFLSSTIYHIGVFFLTVVFSLIGVIILPLTRKVRYRIIRNWARLTLSWLNLTCRLNWEVDGIENIPKNTGIVFAKHQSAWETLALQLVFPEQSQVIKRELLLVPFFGWGPPAVPPPPSRSRQHNTRVAARPYTFRFFAPRSERIASSLRP